MAYREPVAIEMSKDFRVRQTTVRPAVAPERKGGEAAFAAIVIAVAVGAGILFGLFASGHLVLPRF
jgi:hypothetical protein